MTRNSKAIQLLFKVLGHVGRRNMYIRTTRIELRPSTIYGTSKRSRNPNVITVWCD